MGDRFRHSDEGGEVAQLYIVSLENYSVQKHRYDS